ncbi:hypothetical protein LZ31DRAFT_198132 [Colletotrichum somersetense]|nr:hypothetical protein LZ31DRAFT_198132 [Colletotrichum somersetense]
MLALPPPHKRLHQDNTLSLPLSLSLSLSLSLPPDTFTLPSNLGPVPHPFHPLDSPYPAPSLSSHPTLPSHGVPPVHDLPLLPRPQSSARPPPLSLRPRGTQTVSVQKEETKTFLSLVVQKRNAPLLASNCSVTLCVRLHPNLPPFPSLLFNHQNLPS